jgi:hypothetical protein
MGPANGSPTSPLVQAGFLDGATVQDGDTLTG